MTFTAVSAFISALQEWDNLTGELKATDFNSFLHILKYELGTRNESLEKLFKEDTGSMLREIEDRIHYLIQEQHIGEVFLITSLANLVTRFFSSRIETTLDSIISNESMINELKAKHGKEFEENIEDFFAYKNQRRLLSVEYKAKTKNDLYRWQQIVANKLSSEHIAAWESENFSRMVKSSSNMTERLVEKFGDMKLGDILRKELEK